MFYSFVWMTESAFELARSDWSCSARRSLNRGVWGDGPAGLGRHPDFSVKGGHFRSKIDQKIMSIFVEFWCPFWVLFGSQNGAPDGPKTIKNRHQKSKGKMMLFGSLLGPSWERFGSPLGVKKVVISLVFIRFRENRRF